MGYDKEVGMYSDVHLPLFKVSAGSNNEIRFKNVDMGVIGY
jgi:hypothetical protein